MPSHIFVRLGLWDETIASNHTAHEVGVASARAAGIAGVTPEEFHTLDYEVYGYLQRGEDAAARAAAAEGERLASTDSRALVASYNRTAIAARIPLETGDWAAAAAFPVPAESLFPVAAALGRFTRAIGSARAGKPEGARPELAALDSIAARLTARGEPYWARVVHIKRKAAAAWTAFAAGDTTGGLALAAVAADTEAVTDKHPVTPAELLPARELQADMLLAANRPTEARAAYLATLRREPGRARSTFGAARAAELAGDRAAAAAGYRAYLTLMAKADGERPEIAVARRFERSGSK
jgi:hypothetical protein